MFKIPDSAGGLLGKIMDFGLRQIAARTLKNRLPRKLLTEGATPQFSTAVTDAINTSPVGVAGLTGLQALGRLGAREPAKTVTGDQ